MVNTNTPPRTRHYSSLPSLHVTKRHYRRYTLLRVPTRHYTSQHATTRHCTSYTSYTSYCVTTLTTRVTHLVWVGGNFFTWCCASKATRSGVRSTRSDLAHQHSATASSSGRSTVRPFSQQTRSLMVASDHGIAFVDYLLIIEIQPCVHPPLHAGRKLTFGTRLQLLLVASAR